MNKRRFGIRAIFLVIALALLAYWTSMMVIRLEITSLAYQFEQVKTAEREAREEQLRLQAEISKRLADASFRGFWKERGYDEPSPDQVVIVP